MKARSFLLVVATLALLGLRLGHARADQPPPPPCQVTADCPVQTPALACDRGLCVPASTAGGGCSAMTEAQQD